MSGFRPLSVREGLAADDGRFDALHEGVPPWLWRSLDEWLDLVFKPGGGRFVADAKIAQVEIALRIVPALDGPAGEMAHRDLRLRMRRDGGFALDVVDLVVSTPTLLHDQPVSRRRLVAALRVALEAAGSAWEPVPIKDGKTWCLARRVPGPGHEAIGALAANAPRTGEHLRKAWARLYGRQPDPQTAYLEAVRAVECAAKPVVTPNDSDATLGKMIRAMADAPAKWSFALGETDDVAAMARLIWNRRFPRHGTDDESEPISVPMERAEPAVHVAVMLCQFFVSGAVRRADS
ncbi:MAG: hypothetical protein GXY03_00240 [Solirubrobacterales bacterium]|nr:hypothetical protein [Solirubrobacterales bacterium]